MQSLCMERGALIALAYGHNAWVLEYAPVGWRKLLQGTDMLVNHWYNQQLWSSEDEISSIYADADAPGLSCMEKRSKMRENSWFFLTCSYSTNGS
jgi:hypothetical protein